MSQPGTPRSGSPIPGSDVLKSPGRAKSNLNRSPSGLVVSLNSKRTVLTQRLGVGEKANALLGLSKTPQLPRRSIFPSSSSKEMPSPHQVSRALAIRHGPNVKPRNTGLGDADKGLESSATAFSFQTNVPTSSSSSSYAPPRQQIVGGNGGTEVAGTGSGAFLSVDVGAGPTNITASTPSRARRLSLKFSDDYSQPGSRRGSLNRTAGSSTPPRGGRSLPLSNKPSTGLLGYTYTNQQEVLELVKLINANARLPGSRDTSARNANRTGRLQGLSHTSSTKSLLSEPSSALGSGLVTPSHVRSTTHTRVGSVDEDGIGADAAAAAASFTTSTSTFTVGLGDTTPMTVHSAVSAPTFKVPSWINFKSMQTKPKSVPESGPPPGRTHSVSVPSTFQGGGTVAHGGSTAFAAVSGDVKKRGLRVPEWFTDVVFVLEQQYAENQQLREELEQSRELLAMKTTEVIIQDITEDEREEAAQQRRMAQKEFEDRKRRMMEDERKRFQDELKAKLQHDFKEQHVQEKQDILKDAADQLAFIRMDLSAHKDQLFSLREKYSEANKENDRLFVTVQNLRNDVRRLEYIEGQTKLWRKLVHVLWVKTVMDNYLTRKHLKAARAAVNALVLQAAAVQKAMTLGAHVDASASTEQLQTEIEGWVKTEKKDTRLNIFELSKIQYNAQGEIVVDERAHTIWGGRIYSSPTFLNRQYVHLKEGVDSACALLSNTLSRLQTWKLNVDAFFQRNTDLQGEVVDIKQQLEAEKEKNQKLLKEKQKAEEALVMKQLMDKETLPFSMSNTAIHGIEEGEQRDKGAGRAHAHAHAHGHRHGHEHGDEGTSLPFPSSSSSSSASASSSLRHHKSLSVSMATTALESDALTGYASPLNVRHPGQHQNFPTPPKRRIGKCEGPGEGSESDAAEASEGSGTSRTARRRHDAALPEGGHGTKGPATGRYGDHLPVSRLGGVGGGPGSGGGVWASRDTVEMQHTVVAQNKLIRTMRRQNKEMLKRVRSMHRDLGDKKDTIERMSLVMRKYLVVDSHHVREEIAQMLAPGWGSDGPAPVSASTAVGEQARAGTPSIATATTTTFAGKVGSLLVSEMLHRGLTVSQGGASAYGHGQGTGVVRAPRPFPLPVPPSDRMMPSNPVDRALSDSAHPRGGYMCSRCGEQDVLRRMGMNGEVDAEGDSEAEDEEDDDAQDADGNDIVTADLTNHIHDRSAAQSRSHMSRAESRLAGGAKSVSFSERSGKTAMASVAFTNLTLPAATTKATAPTTNDSQLTSSAPSGLRSPSAPPTSAVKGDKENHQHQHQQQQQFDLIHMKLAHLRALQEQLKYVEKADPSPVLRQQSAIQAPAGSVPFPYASAPFSPSTGRSTSASPRTFSFLQVHSPAAADKKGDGVPATPKNGSTTTATTVSTKGASGTSSPGGGGRRSKAKNVSAAPGSSFSQHVVADSSIHSAHGKYRFYTSVPTGPAAMAKALKIMEDKRKR